MEEETSICIFRPVLSYTGRFLWGDCMGLWKQIQDNVTFILVCVAIIVGLSLLARLAERFLPAKRKVTPARRVTIIAVCAAIATILHMLDFPLLFLAPDFYKLDFSELPVMLCGFYLGPSATVVCEALKIILKLLLKGTSTAFVGDFANFAVGCSLVLPAAIIYHTKKSRVSALWGLVVGSVILTLFGSAFNGIYLLPKFSQLYGIPLDAIIGMGSKINGGITSVSTFVMFAVAPLNLIKGVSISVLTLLLYKRVARPLFGK
jgi:riboflavin transporter FmnP